MYGFSNCTLRFPYTALIRWFYNRDGVFTARYGLSLYIEFRISFKLLKG